MVICSKCGCTAFRKFSVILNGKVLCTSCNILKGYKEDKRMPIEKKLSLYYKR